MKAGSMFARACGFTVGLLVLCASYAQATVITGCKADGQSCQMFTYKKCSSNVLHTSFILDRSGSMEWGMQCNGKCSGADSCPEVIPDVPATEKGCIRSDIMRIVLRLVIKNIFDRFSRTCYEYLESNLYKATGTSCVDAGFTTPFFHVIWWAKTLAERQLFQTFSKDNDSSLWSRQMNEYLYNGDGTRIESRWEKVDGDYLIKDETVNTFFKSVFLKDRCQGADCNTYPAKFPYGAGATEPVWGQEEWTRIVTDEIWPQLTPKQRAGSTFPTFLMTDGIINGNNMQTRMEDANANFKLLYPAAETYGLGLTGNPDLTQIQTELYTATEYGIETKVGNRDVPHFFSDQDSANDIVDAIISRIDNCDEICYQPAGYDAICRFVGEEVPIFPGFNDRDDSKPDYVQVSSSSGGPASNLIISKATPRTDLFVRFRGTDTIYKIPKSTTLCELASQDTPDQKYVEYTSDGQCKCCVDAGFAKDSGDCLCDFRTNSYILKTTETVGNPPVERLVTQYSAQSRLASEVLAAPTAKFTSENEKNTVGQDSGSGGGTPGDPAGPVTGGDGGIPDAVEQNAGATATATGSDSSDDAVATTLSLCVLVPSLLICFLG